MTPQEQFASAPSGDGPGQPRVNFRQADALSITSMRKIILSRGKVALVDDSDYDRVNQFKWSANRNQSGNWYAISRNRYLHHFILSLHTQIDHANGDGLDNQRHNLRPATNSQNRANSKKQAGSSRYRGVRLNVNVRSIRWRAGIHLAGRSISLGTYPSEEEAGLAYNRAALIYFGEFARLNPIEF